MDTIKLPPLPTDAAVYNQAQCPSRLILDRIADKWTTLIIGILAQSKYRRFNELRRMIGGISQKMLTQTLRGLERDGLVRRTVYPEVPPRVEYALTALGQTLCEPIAALIRWSEGNIHAITAAQQRYDASA